jgi:serine/threonine protein kinase
VNLPFSEYCTACGEPRKVEEVRAPPVQTVDLARLRELYVGRAVNVRLPRLEPKPLPSPLKLHGYECRSLLGKTSLSATLLCVDERGANHVLKIPADFLDWKVYGVGGRRTTYSSIGKEGEALKAVASLNHPCIVKFESFLEAAGDDPPALVFEFCEGGSLADLLREYRREGKRLDPVTAVRIIVQVADALAAIHELGYAHGDVKPENILFSRDRIPRLADFNSARAIAATTRSVVPFTPGYAAPEHVKTGRPSQKGDVWSLALALYEAVKGEPLFEADLFKYQEKLAALEREGEARAETGDRELDEVLARCLRLNPDERPSMRDLEDMLIRYLERKRQEG